MATVGANPAEIVFEVQGLAVGGLEGDGVGVVEPGGGIGLAPGVMTIVSLQVLPDTPESTCHTLLRAVYPPGKVAITTIKYSP